MLLPRFIKKMLAVFRGRVSPVFIFLSIMLGFWFGLVPGFSGFHLVLAVLVLVLNIHLGLFLLSAGVGKTLCFAAAPLLYHAGVATHDYLSWLLSLLASLPVIAITDFSKYSVAGALVVGPIIGAVAGLLMARSVIGFRKKLLKFEEGSERFKKWYSNRWVRILDRLLIGKRTKDAKSLFMAKKKVVRKVGVALAVVVLAAGAAAVSIVRDEAVRDYAAGTLTRANGAEVNLEEVNLSVLEGVASASGIQVTDPENPQNNQVYVGKIAADASVYNLLVGKLVMDSVEVSDVKFDQKRATPGQVAKTEDRPPIFDPNDFKIEVADLAKLETYLRDAKALKERLQKLRRWLPKPKKEAAKTPRQVPEEYLGYLRARSIAPASPRVLAKQTLLDHLEIPSLLFGDSKVLLTNINDAPSAAKLPITLEIESYDTPARLRLTVDCSTQAEAVQVSGSFEGLDLGKMQLSRNAGLMFKSGMASGGLTGDVTDGIIDLTIDVAVRDLQAQAQGDGILGLGSKSTSDVLDVLENLNTTMRVVGPVSEPRLSFDVKGLQASFKEALVKAGRERLTEEIDKRLGKELEEKLGDKVPEELKDVLKKPTDLIDGLGGLLGGKNKKEQEEK